MTCETDTLARRLEEFRAYLHLLARLQLDPRLKGKVDPSGVVQQTLWEGYRALSTGPVPHDTQLAALLRRTLANNLADEIRKNYADKRDVDRERSLDASSVQLECFLVGALSSPEERAERNEELIGLAHALEKLPEAQGQAVELHYLRGWRLEEIARHLGRSKAAVAGLLQRGLHKLREFLQGPVRDEPCTPLLPTTPGAKANSTR
jgi:RNA polymerase sigma-70 factor, ECF subfamily